MKSAEEIIWWVLEAIKRELELQEYGLLTVINFDLEDLTSKDSNSPSIKDVRKVVYLLERKYKALEVADIDYPKERKVHQENALDYRPTRGTATRFVFEMPDRTKFDDIYRDYRKKQQKISDDKDIVASRQQQISPAQSAQSDPKKTEALTPPSRWELTKDGGFLEDKKVWFTFLNLGTDKHLYFEHAWQNKYNQTVPYKELYESKPGSKYPNRKGENWKINDNIRATMRKLRKEFENKKVPIAIETKKGIKVFIRK